MAQNLYLRQTWRYLRIFAGYGGFVTFVKSNAKALSTDVPSIKSTLAPCGAIYSGILACTYSRFTQYGVPTRYHSLAKFISILVCTHLSSTNTSRPSQQ